MIERQERKYHFSGVDIEDLLEKVLKIMQYPLTKKKFEIDKSVYLKEKMIICDADAIQQLLLNLISNAIKYSHKEKYLGIRLWESEQEVIIKIIDKGIGIRKKDQKEIFNNYFRAKDAVAKGVGGVGLGLAIVNDIVKAHKGRIELESEIDSGTQIKVYLPRGDIS